MMYAEAAYFDRMHVAQRAAWQEHRRLLRIDRECVARLAKIPGMPPELAYLFEFRPARLLNRSHRD
jgi:hypothetical protein